MGLFEDRFAEGMQNPEFAAGNAEALEEIRLIVHPIYHENSSIMAGTPGESLNAVSAEGFPPMINVFFVKPTPA